MTTEENKKQSPSVRYAYGGQVIEEKSTEEYTVILDPKDSKPKVCFTLKYPWEDVVECYHARFPKNPKLNIADTEENREIKEDGSLHIIRTVTIDLSQDMPGWMTSIVGKPMIQCTEKSVVCHKNKRMEMFSENVSFKEKFKVEEDCLYCQHPENPNWTYKEMKPRLKFNVWLLGLETSVEKFLENTYISKTGNAIIVEKGMLEERMQNGKSSNNSNRNETSATSSLTVDHQLDVP